MDVVTMWRVVDADELRAIAANEWRAFPIPVDWFEAMILGGHEQILADGNWYGRARGFHMVRFAVTRAFAARVVMVLDGRPQVWGLPADEIGMVNANLVGAIEDLGELPTDPMHEPLDIDLTNERGLLDAGTLAQAVLVRAPFAAVVDALGAAAKVCVRDVFGKRVRRAKEWAFVVQLHGHAWTLLLGDRLLQLPEGTCERLSARLGCRVLECGVDDDAPGTSIRIHDDGRQAYFWFEDFLDRPSRVNLDGREFEAANPWDLLDVILRSEDALWCTWICLHAFAERGNRREDTELTFLPELRLGTRTQPQLDGTAWIAW